MITQLGDPLFSQGSVDELLRRHIQAMRDEASGLSTDYLLSNSIETICQALVERYTVSVPTIKDAVQDIRRGDTEFIKIPMQDFGRNLQMEGTRHRFYVSFEGDDGFFRVHGSPFSLTFPRAAVDPRSKELCFTLETHDGTAKELQDALDGQLRLVRDFLATMRAPADTHNRTLADQVRSIVEPRLSRLRAAQAVDEQLPYKRRSDGSD